MTSFNPGAWQQADIDNTADSKAPEPGVYETSVQDARAFTSEKGNDVMVVELRVLSGPEEGHTWSEVRGFKNEGSIKAAKSMCARLGVDVASINSLDRLDTALETVIGQYYAIEVKRNGEYLNTYITGRLTSAPPKSDVPNDGFEPVAASAASTAGEDDPPPF